MAGNKKKDYLLGDFEGTEAEKRQLRRIIEKADFSQEYGPLGYMLAEMQTAGPRMTTAVQNVVAAKVVEQFDAVYDQYVSDFNRGKPTAVLDSIRYGDTNHLMGKAEYFARNRQAYLSVLDRPINLGWAREQVDPVTGNSAGELMPRAFQASTVHQGMKWLGASEMPQAIQVLMHMGTKEDGSVDFRQVGRNFVDELQQGWLHAYENIYNYKPPTVGGKQNTFSLFFGDQVYKGVREMRRAEAILNNGNLSMGISDAAENAGGGVDANRAPIDSAFGISADNSFTSRSYLPNDPDLAERVRGAIVGVQEKFFDRDIWGSYARLNVQTGRVDVDKDRGRGDFGRTNASQWEAGIDPVNVQVFGIDPESPAAKMGMQEGAFIQSFQRVLGNRQLSADLVDAFQNGHAAAIAFMQPDENGVLRDHISIFNPAAIVGHNADQGREDNWIKQFARTLDPEMGRTVATLGATYRNLGTKDSPDWQVLPKPPSVSRTEGHTAIPLELWTTDPRYSSGMYRNKNGDFALAPLSDQPSDYYNVRVSMDPNSISKFADLYETWHEVWTGEKKAIGKIEAEAKKVVEQRYQNAVKAGHADKFPSLESAIRREMEQGLRRAGISVEHADFIRGGVLVENQLRQVQKSVVRASAEVEPDFTIEQFDQRTSSQPRSQQDWVTDVTPARVADQIRAEQRAILREDNLRPPTGDSLRLSRLATDDDYAGEVFGVRAANHFDDGGESLDALSLFLDRPVRGESGGSVGSHLSGINRFVRETPGEQTDDPWIERGRYRAYGAKWAQDYTYSRLPVVTGQGAPRSEWLIPQQEGVSLGPPKAGMILAGTGHRPNKLGGWGNERAYNRLVTLAEEQIGKLQPSRVISGGAQGWDQALAQAALNKGVPVTMAIPFKGFEKRWSRSAQNRLNQLIKEVRAQEGGAVETLVDPGENAVITRGDAGRWLAKRNEYMIDNADMTLALYDNSAKGGTANAVSYSMVSGKPVKNIWGKFSGQPVRTQIPMAFADEPDSVDTGEDILGANPGRYADRVTPNGEEGAFHALSVERANRGMPLSAVRSQGSTGLYDDKDIRESNESYALDASDRAFQEALRAVPLPSPISSNSAQIGRRAAEKGYYAPGWGDFFSDVVNPSHPENEATYRALAPVAKRQDRAELERVKVQELQGYIRDFVGIGRPDIAAHVRLGETPADVEEARKSKRGYGRQALRQISQNLNLGLSFQRGKEADLFEQLETVKGANPELYAQLRGTVLADPAGQHKAAKAWMKTVKVVRGDASVPEEPDWGDLPLLDGPRDDMWENRSGGFDFEKGDTPADRQAKAAYAWYKQNGDIQAAREKVLYPVAGASTPQPARLLPHVSDNVVDALRSQFTDTGFEESGFLVGRRNDQGGVEIFDVVRPEQRGKISRNRTRTTREMVEEANQMAEDRGGFLAGYVHTHPGDPSQEPQYLRPSNTDVLTRSLVGEGSLHNENWGEDSVHAIYNPVSGNVAFWNHGEGTVIDVTQSVRQPSTRPARVGLRKSRKAFSGVEARNSFEDVEGGWTPYFDGEGDDPTAPVPVSWFSDPARRDEGLWELTGDDPYLQANTPQGDPMTANNPRTPRSKRRLAPRDPNAEKGAVVIADAAPDTMTFSLSGLNRHSSAGNNGAGASGGNGATPPSSGGGASGGGNGNGPVDPPDMPDFPDDWDQQEPPDDLGGDFEAVTNTPQPTRASGANPAANPAPNAARAGSNGTARSSRASRSTPSPRRNGNPAPRSEREGRTIINDPGVMRRLQPQEGWLLESEDAGGGGIRVFRANKEGEGAAASVQWYEMDIDTGEYSPARSVPGWGTISHEGELIAEVSQADYDTWRDGRSSLTPTERAASRVREKIGIQEIEKIRKREAGQVRPVGTTGEAFELVSGENADGSSRVVMGSSEISAAHATALKATTDALNSNLPSDPVARVAAVKQRILNNALEEVDKFVDNQIKQGVSPDLARASGERFKAVVTHYADAAARVVENSMGDDLGVSRGDVRAWNSTDIRLKSLGEVQSLLERSPAAKRALEQTGRTAEDVWGSGEYFPVKDEAGNVFDIGTQGKYSYQNGQYGHRQQSGNGIFQGKFGAAMYAGYMLTREWQMLMGQHMQRADDYGKYFSQMGVVNMPGDVEAGSTDVGYLARQQYGAHYMGKGAFEVMGGFQDIPFLMSGMGGAPARLGVNASLAGGIAAGSAILGAGIGMMAAPGTALAAAGAALPGIGLAVGGTILGGSLLMEAYNAIVQPEDPATWGNAFRGVEKMYLENKGWNAARAAKFGETYDQRGADYQDLSRFDWSRQKSHYTPTKEEISAHLTWQEAQIYNYEGVPEEVEKMTEAAGRLMLDTGENIEDIQAGFYMQKRLTGKVDYGEFAGNVSRIAMSRGITSGMLLNEAGQYAALSGFKPGDKGFEEAFQAYATEPDLGASELMSYEARSWNQFGSQIQALMPAGDKAFYGRGVQIAKQYNLNNQRSMGVYQGMVSSAQMFSSRDLTDAQYERFAGIISENSPYVGGVIATAMENFMQGGGSLSSAFTLGNELSSANASGAGAMSTQDATMYGRLMQGDLRAYSYQAWQPGGNMGNAFFDRAGRSIMQHNGAVGIGVYNTWAPKVGLGGGNMTTAGFLGTNNAEIVSTFNEGGFAGLQMLAADKSYAASMASIGVQLKGIALQENFYWGSNAGGSWSNPTAGSAWGIEDRQLALQDQSARANFADQWARMTMSNEFAIRREGNQLTRMNASHQFSQWQLGTQYNQLQQQQIWTQQDWAYQDTTRGINFGWQMEDLNEAIRFSSGRERRQLVRQRDRAALSYNMEEGQIETQRDRQEQLWAQEEERFQKQRQYTLEMQDLDRESFDINKDQREEFFKMDVEAYNRRLKEYEEEKKLSEELRELQRKFQYDQLQLQKEAAGAQAAAAAAQYEINKAIAEGQKNWEELTGTVEQMNNYNMAFRLANATNEMFKTMDNVSTYRIDKLIALIREIQKAAPGSGTPWGGERE